MSKSPWGRCVCGTHRHLREGTRYCAHHAPRAVAAAWERLEEAAAGEVVSVSVSVPVLQPSDELEGWLELQAGDVEAELVLGRWVARQHPKLLKAITEAKE